MKKPKGKKWLVLLIMSVVVMSGSTMVMASGNERHSVGNLTMAAQKAGYTGWKTNDNKRFYYENGKMVISSFKTIDGYTYYFNSNGVMMTGFYTINGSKYYFDSNGRMQKNCWQKTANGKWYYFGSDGKAKTGWVTTKDPTDGKYYKHYLDSSGVEVYGWQKIGGYWYYFYSSGHMATGWVSTKDPTDGIYYKHYLDSNGHELYGWQKISGYWYYFYSSGHMATGWVETKDPTNGIYFKHYLDAYGREVYGWQTISGKTYYFDGSGHMATGWKTISGYKYYFGNDGVMRTGWQTIDGNKYYLFQHSSSVHYPVPVLVTLCDAALLGQIEEHYDEQPTGSAIRNHYCFINGYWYYFLDDGSMAKGLVYCDSGLRYFGNDGKMWFQGPITVDGVEYVYIGYGKFQPADFSGLLDFDG